MLYALARCARGKIKANNMADIEEEILLKANLFLLLVLSDDKSASKPKVSKNIQLIKIKFLADFFPTVRLFVFVFEILTYGCKRTHNAQLCSMPATFKANERCYNRTFGLYGLETLNHRSELKILWDTFRSQIAELWFPYDRRIANDRR